MISKNHNDAISSDSHNMALKKCPLFLIIIINKRIIYVLKFTIFSHKLKTLNT